LLNKALSWFDFHSDDMKLLMDGLKLSFVNEKSFGSVFNDSLAKNPLLHFLVFLRGFVGFEN
jgi:hypothetical protein